MIEKISIAGDHIKLDALLKFATLVGTGGEAKIRIAEGEVTVNGAVCLQRGKKIRTGDIVRLGEEGVLVENEGASVLS